MAFANTLVPLGFSHQQTPADRINILAQTVDAAGLMQVFADWAPSQRWTETKQLFESWIRCLDRNGKPNKPDLGLFNSYLRANLMAGASAGDLLDLVAQMETFEIAPNTASFNLALKAMWNDKEAIAAEKLLERMLQTGNESLPDAESYELVVGLLFSQNQIDAALKYLDINLKSGYMVSMNVFTICVKSCVDAGRLDTLVSIIGRCKSMDQNKDLCPSWNLCYYIADVALQEDNSKLAFYALEFFAKQIVRSEMSRPTLLRSVDEGLIVAALGTAGRTYSPTLLDASWDVLRRSLRKTRAPSVESYLGKIYAHASLGNLPKAFRTLNEFESTHGLATSEGTERNVEDLFSPFTSLSPLVVACSRKGFETLDSVYFQLENLSKAEPPYKSVAALNCIVLGCANIWDLDRAYQTFDAISDSFGLKPDVHSYNALMCAFGKHKKTYEASRVFDHMVSLDVKPNATSYALLVDAHIVNRDAAAALLVIDEMVTAGFVPTREMMKKIQRRCIREFDVVNDERASELRKKFGLRVGGENRRGMLFDLNYGTS